MNKKMHSLLATGLFLLCANQATIAQPSWYAGVQHSFHEVEGSGLFSSEEATLMSIGAIGGYQFSEYLALEGSLFFGINDDKFGVVEFNDGTSYREEAELDMGFDIGVKGFIPVHKMVSLFGAAKIRYYKLSFSDSFSNGSRGENITLSNGRQATLFAEDLSNNETKLRLGGGVRYSPIAPLNLELGYYLADGLSLNASYNF